MNKSTAASGSFRSHPFIYVTEILIFDHLKSISGLSGYCATLYQRPQFCYFCEQFCELEVEN